MDYNYQAIPEKRYLDGRQYDVHQFNAVSANEARKWVANNLDTSCKWIITIITS